MIIRGAEFRAELPEFDLSSAAEIARKLTKEGMSASAAAKEAASISGLKKGDIYKALIEN